MRVAYSTITVPAMVAMPVVISANSSPRPMSRRYGLISSGDSTMPMNTLAAVPSPSAPPMPSVRRSSQASAFTNSGSTRQ